MEDTHFNPIISIIGLLDMIERGLAFFFSVGINLAGDFMMRKQENVGPETPPAAGALH